MWRYDSNKSNGESNKKDKRNRSSTFKPVVSGKKSTNQCPLQDNVHIIWQCETFKKKFIDDRYKIVMEKKLWFSCLDGSHAIKNGKTRKCSIDSCEKSHNRLVYKMVKSTESKKKEETTLTTIYRNIVRGTLYVVPIKVRGMYGFSEETVVLCVTGSSQTWVDQGLLEKLNLGSEEVTIQVVDICGTTES